MDDTTALIPIGTVSSRTGLSEHVLRAWERRYGAVKPERTAGGHRLYRESDVQRLRLLKRATDAGHSISKVAALAMRELVAMATKAGAAATEEVEAGAARVGPDARAVSAKHCGEALDAVERLDAARLRSVLMRGLVQANAETFVELLLGPLLEEVGERWHRRRLTPAQEHLASVTVRGVLGWLLDRYEANGTRPLLVVTTPSGERHEFGAMMAGAAAADEGWRVLYLGPSLPLADVATLADGQGARVVALSAAYEVAALELAEEAARVRETLPRRLLVVAGGRGASARRARLEAAGVLVVPELPRFRRMLRALTSDVFTEY